MSSRKPQPKALDRSARGHETLARRPSSEFRLTDAERDLLQDPEWVTEDEADQIVIGRRQSEPTIPLEEVLTELGLDD